MFCVAVWGLRPTTSAVICESKNNDKDDGYLHIRLRSVARYQGSSLRTNLKVGTNDQHPHLSRAASTSLLNVAAAMDFPDTPAHPVKGYAPRCPIYTLFTAQFSIASSSSSLRTLIDHQSSHPLANTIRTGQPCFSV
ncbi:hypothetical protein BJ912DRAFT_637664 [Pholiota molesta]|nr:hypothetical protein BJ912DRAFT_637664 [Pholiota molesta]